MKKLLYIHGFASSGQSGTVKILRTKLYPLGIQVVAKDLPLNPLQAEEELQQFIAEQQPDLILGTSMGAMFAERQRGYKRILVNPSFHMSVSCKRMGFGKHAWLSPRADGQTNFMITKQLIDQFKELEQRNFAGEIDTENVWAFFGNHDPIVNFQEEYKQHYGDEHFYVFEGEHRLNDKVLSRVIIPKITEILA